MSQSLTCTLGLSSQRLSKRNKSLNSKRKGQNSWSTRPSRTKSPRLSKLRVRPRQPNFSEKLSTRPQLSLSWGESRLPARSQLLCPVAAIESSLKQTLSSWTWLQVWTRILRKKEQTKPLKLLKRNQPRLSETSPHENRSPRSKRLAYRWKKKRVWWVANRSL